MVRHLRGFVTKSLVQLCDEKLMIVCGEMLLKIDGKSMENRGLLSNEILVFFDGKSDGMVVFSAKTASPNLVYYRSTTSQINCSLTIEWEQRTCANSSTFFLSVLTY
jgi:hypothetical protein